MIELERSNDGFIKSMGIKVAEDALRLSKGQIERNQTYWKLPEDSSYKVDSNGFLVVKPVVKVEPKRKGKKEEVIDEEV